MAVVLNRDFRGARWARTAFLLPMVATPVATSLVWMMMFNPTLGVLNYLLGLVGLPPSIWVADPWLVDSLHRPRRCLASRALRDDDPARRAQIAAARAFRVGDDRRRDPLADVLAHRHAVAAAGAGGRADLPDDRRAQGLRSHLGHHGRAGPASVRRRSTSTPTIRPSNIWTSDTARRSSSSSPRLSPAPASSGFGRASGPGPDRVTHPGRPSSGHRSERCRRKLARAAESLLFYGVLIALLVFFLFPLVWMILTSLKTNVQATAYPPSGSSRRRSGTTSTSSPRTRSSPTW